MSPSAANSAEGESGDEGDKETAKHRDSYVEALDAPRLEKVRHSLKKLESKRNEYLYDKHVIGRVSNRRRDIVKELASISSRKVPFKWQRGNKIGKWWLPAYTCQLFVIQRREIAISTFFKDVPTICGDFPRCSDDVQVLPKSSEDVLMSCKRCQNV